MADHHESAASHQARGNDAIWDGRFGERFDDEVSTPGVAWTIIGTGLITVIAMILMYGFFQWFVADSGRVSEPLTLAVGEQPAPPLPRLQAYPEAEYRAYDRQMTHQLESYGWIDEQAGIAHIPIDQAIALLVAQGLPDVPTAPATDAGSGTGADASDETTRDDAAGEAPNP